MEDYTSLKIKPSMTKTIRKYFKKKHSKVNSVLIVLFGAFLAVAGLISYYKAGTYIMLFGLLIAGTGISWLLEDSFAGEKEADRAKIELVKILRKRGIQKLNIVNEQAGLIEPVLLVGFGADPDSSFQKAKLYEKVGVGVIKRTAEWIKQLLKKTEREYFPEAAYMIGSDEQLRSLLIEVSLYYMIEDEILLYIADADISTGLIYRESMSECFYQDVEATKFSQSVYKAFHIRKKKYVNSLRESFVLYMGGSNFHSSIDSRHKNSVLDKRFMAMRNLIREKKNGGQG